MKTSHFISFLCMDNVIHVKVMMLSVFLSMNNVNVALLDECNNFYNKSREMSEDVFLPFCLLFLDR